MDMMKRMSNSEKQIYFEDWLNMFGEILGRYFRGETKWLMKDLEPALWELLKTIEEVFPTEKSSKTDLFLRECAKELEKTSVELLCDCEHNGSSWLVCRCESSTWIVRESRLLLMDELKLDTKLLGETLIRYGFQYGYDKEYYEYCCNNLCSMDLEVKGMPFRGNFSDSILDNGNLRMQLGIELLLTCFANPDTENNYEGVLRCLWRATSFPFITGDELFNMLKPHCLYEGDGPSLQDVCDAYVERNTIFEVPVKMQPRSLKVLSKIQIRKSLYEAKGIRDEAIDSLQQLPRTLQNYLKLGED